MQRKFVKVNKYFINFYCIQRELLKNASTTSKTNRKYSTTITSAAHTENTEVINEIKKLLSCDTELARAIYDGYPAIRHRNQLADVKTNIDFLLARNVTMESIVENAFVLAMPASKMNFCC